MATTDLWDLSAEDAALVRAVREQMRPGGKPIDVALRSGIMHRLPMGRGIELTNECLRNIEERLAAQEGRYA